MQKNLIPDIDLGEFSYELPQSRIAEYPLDERDKSKLLVAYAQHEKILHKNFFDIVNYIPSGALLIRNITRVLQARIFLTKPTGGKAEVLIVDPVEPSSDPLIALQAKSFCMWNCIVGGKKILPGTILSTEFVLKEEKKFFLRAEILEKDGMNATVRFSWSGNFSFAEILDAVGKIPLPPYIRRKSEEADAIRYQTVYAKNEGSVAAPTAGLHFTEKIFSGLKEKNADFAEVTLHVGLGTFKPLEADSIAEHEMHSERIFVPAETIEKILSHLEKKSSAPVITIGTTSTRTIESLYWFGLKLFLDDRTAWNSKTIFLSQWEPYELKEKFSSGKKLPEAKEIFLLIKNWLAKSEQKFLSGETQIIIVPGYEFQVCSGIVTNFHQPHSTLILLVAAFTGKKLWRKIYDEALANDYRFLSYGDASLLFR